MSELKNNNINLNKKEDNKDNESIKNNDNIIDDQYEDDISDEMLDYSDYDYDNYDYYDRYDEADEI